MWEWAHRHPVWFVVAIAFVCQDIRIAALAAIVGIVSGGTAWKLTLAESQSEPRRLTDKQVQALKQLVDLAPRLEALEAKLLARDALIDKQSVELNDHCHWLAQYREGKEKA